MSAFSIKIEGYDKLMDVIRDLPKEKFERVEEVFETAADEITLMQKQLAPKDNSQLANAITNKKVSPMNVEMTAQKFYAPFIEFGTKSRAIIPAELASIANDYRQKTSQEGGKGFYDNILEWVKRKGITGTYSVKTRRRVGNRDDRNMEDEQAAWAIYLSIQRHGVTPHPFFFAPYFQVRNRIITDVKKILVS